MKSDVILKNLENTGIHQEEDSATPISGAQVRLPYMIVRKTEDIGGDDFGRIRMKKTAWTVALFTSNKDQRLENLVSQALCNVGAVKIKHFPDGTPYQTNFEFTSIEPLVQ